MKRIVVAVLVVCSLALVVGASGNTSIQKDPGGGRPIHTN